MIPNRLVRASNAALIKIVRICGVINYVIAGKYSVGSTSETHLPNKHFDSVSHLV
jgi:hypothetical protein